MPTIQEVFARQQAAEREFPPELEVAVDTGDDAAVERFVAGLPLDAAQQLRGRIEAERRRRAAERERDEHQRRASEAQAAIAERGRAGQLRIAHWRKVRGDVEDVAAEARVSRDQAVQAGDVGAAVEAQLRLVAAQGLLSMVEDATA